MSDYKIRATMDTSSVEQGLKRIEQTAQKVNDAFADLKSAIAGIAIGQFITNSLNLASRVDALGKATGIATENIRGFQLAVGQAGGNSDQASDAISDLVKNIGDAANGSSELVSAFSQAGVSLNDLRTLSEQDILKKTIDGIAKIGDASTQSSVKAKIFGEALKTVDIGTVANNFGRLSAESGKYAAAATSAREAQLKMNQAIDKLQESVVIALKPINDFIAAIDPQAINTFATTIVDLGKAFVALYAISKIASLMTMVSTAMMAVGAGSMGVAGALSRMTAVTATATTGLGSIVTGLKNLAFVFTTAIPMGAGLNEVMSSLFRNFSRIFGGVARLIPILGQVYLAFEVVNAAIKIMTGSGLVDWAERAAKALGLIKQTSKEASDEAKKENDAEVQRQQNRAAAAKKQEEDLKRGQEALAKIGQAYAKNSLAAKQDLQVTGEALGLKGMQLVQERMMIGFTEDQVEMRRTMLGLDDEMYAKQADIAREIEKLKLERSSLKKGQEDESKILSGQISILQNQSKEVESLYGRHKEGIKDQVVLLQSARLVEKARLQDIQNTTDAINAQISRQQALGDILRGANQQARDATDRPSASQSVGLSSIQKQILDIQESARKAAIEAGRSFAANFEDNGDGLTPERARELAQGLDQIAGAYKRVAGAQIEVAEANYETARSFSTGWKEAFAKYAEDAQDSSKQAATYFERFTQGFEDAIVSFVTRGKFSFKDFANSIIADFARIQARRALTNFMTGGGGTTGNVMGNLFAFGKSLFGFANGGMMAAGQPGIVGERGPELFVPQSAGKVISNAQAFGNREPQVINNAVTYTIQAVDASSFRSLIARDPSFIYAVTEQGRRSQPTRRSA